MRVCSTVAESILADIPVIVPAFNNPSYLRGMLVQLYLRGLRNIVVIDNASTIRLDIACSFARTVVRLPENRGPHYLFEDEREFDALPQFFCITDPDLELNPALPKDFVADFIRMTEEFMVGKVGFSLDISDTAAMRNDDFRNGNRICKIWEWERQFWEENIASTTSGDPIYRAPIDTTFAVYNKKYFRRENIYPALRVAGRYICKHLPWYNRNPIPAEETVGYAATQKYSTYGAAALPNGRDLECV